MKIQSRGHRDERGRELLLVEESPTEGGVTQTRNLVCLLFNSELVVISNLLPRSNVPLRVDDNLLLCPHGDNPGIAVRLKWQMVSNWQRALQQDIK